MIPLTMAAGRISLPDTLRITGRHTSIAVAPADATGANGPKCLFIAWAATNVNSSLNMFTSNAIVPSSEAARTTGNNTLIRSLRRGSPTDSIWKGRDSGWQRTGVTRL